MYSGGDRRDRLRGTPPRAADANRGNNVFTGEIETKTLRISRPEETENRMKDSDLKVMPGSLETFPAAPPKPDAKSSDAKPAGTP